MKQGQQKRPSNGRIALSVLMVTMGVLHFTHGETFASIMPDYLPWHLELVYLSGVLEVALGIALSVESTRVLAAWGLAALFVAVFPANIHMALHPEIQIAGLPSWMAQPSPVAAWLRLPLQGVLIWWATRYTRRSKPVSHTAALAS